MSGMRIGLDFDNTIVCYDEVFYEEAVGRGIIASCASTTKESVKQALIGAGKEDSWTELQGFVYGKCMERCSAYPGFFEFLSAAREKGAACRIISHKTRFPYKGPAYDLHKAALDWLHANGFFTTWGFAEGDVMFLESKQLKLRRIAETGCSHFVDDLPEFLLEKDFPGGVEPILFCPGGMPGGWQSGRIRAFRGWGEIRGHLLGV